MGGFYKNTINGLATFMAPLFHQSEHMDMSGTGNTLHDRFDSGIYIVEADYTQLGKAL